MKKTKKVIALSLDGKRIYKEELKYHQDKDGDFISND